MSSYFGAGHEWQSTDLPLNHFSAQKVCSNPYNSPLTDSRGLTNGYQSYHSGHPTAYVMSPNPSVQRYVSPAGVDPHSIGHNRFIDSSVAFPHHSQHHMSAHSHHSLQHHSHPHHSHAHHPHPDHVFSGGALLSAPSGAAAASIQASVPYHNLSQHSSPSGVQSLPLSGHSVTNLLQTETCLQDSSSGTRVITPDQILSTPQNSGHQHPVYSSSQSPASCKLSANQFENNSIAATTRSASTTDESPAFDSPPPTTPEMNPMNQQNQNNKQFFPWMKSYTGESGFASIRGDLSELLPIKEQLKKNRNQSVVCSLLCLKCAERVVSVERDVLDLQIHHSNTRNVRTAIAERWNSRAMDTSPVCWLQMNGVNVTIFTLSSFLSLFHELNNLYFYALKASNSLN